MRPLPRPLLVFVALVLSLPQLGCRSDSYGSSLLGRPLRNAPPSEAALASMTSALDEARLAAEADPDSEDAAIWHGRRLAYLARYDEAIAVYTAAIEQHPESHRLRRHRGHRYITTRRFDLAVADFERAWELAQRVPDAVEPDGAPNERGIPIGTDRGNILYHLGLAHYLRGEWRAAAEAFGWRAATDRLPDNHASTAYWRYLALRRVGDDAAARAALAEVVDGADIIENQSYHDLCLLFRGERTFEELDANLDGPVTPSLSALAYGLSAYALVEGRADDAEQRWRAILADPTRMDAFGYIAAEAEIARLERSN